MLTTRSFTFMIKVCPVMNAYYVSLSASQKLKTGWPQSSRGHEVKMKSDKTDFIWLGSKQQWAKTQCQSICLNGVHIPVSTGHLFRGMVRQSAHFYPSCPTSGSLLYLLYVADPDAEAVSEHRFSQCSCTRIDCQSSWLLQQRVVPDKHQHYEDSAINSILSHSTHHAETKVWQHHTDTWRWSLLVTSVTEDCLQTVYYHLQVPASDCAEISSRAVRASHNQCQL